MKKIAARKPLPLTLMILLDLILFGIALLVFAYFHHVCPSEESAVGLSSTRTYARPTAAVTPAPSPTPSPVPTLVLNAATPDEVVLPTTEPAHTPDPTIEPVITPTVEPTPDPVGYFGSKFKDKFTTGEVISEKNRYVSENLCITVTKHKEPGLVYHLADIYMRDITSFQTLFADDKFGKGYQESTYHADIRSNAVLTMNGDFYGLRNYGVIVRNGTLYRTMKSAICDWCVLYWDGTMECYAPGPVNAEAIMEKGAYQSWYFGPMLLDENGQPKTTFNSHVEKRNPRSAIGYYEPGHYCLVVVEGRNDDSNGLKLVDFSKLMYDLGCKAAYNLDGGETAQMVFDDKTQNKLIDSGRKCSDFITIVEPTFD